MLLLEAAEIFSLTTLQGLTSEALKRRYHTLAQKYHPDKGGTAEEFIRLRQAYTVLKDALRRHTPLHESDSTSQTETQNTTQTPPPDFNQLWKNFQELQKAYQDLSTLHHKWDQTFNLQIKIINQTVNRINEYAKRYNHHYTTTEQILKQQLEQLETHYRRKWWEQLVRVPKLSEEQYILRHNELIKQYNQEVRTLNKRYNEQVTGAYQQAFETFIELIKDL